MPAAIGFTPYSSYSRVVSWDASAGSVIFGTSVNRMVSNVPGVVATVTSLESPARRASNSKREFSDEISLSRVSVTRVGSTGVADASGANASAAPTARPPTTAILRVYMVISFQTFRRRFGCTAGGPPAQVGDDLAHTAENLRER